MFKNMKIATKIIFSFVVIGLLVGLMGGLNYRALKHAEESDSALYHLNTVPLGHVAELNGNFQRHAANVRDMVLAHKSEIKKEIREHLKTQVEKVKEDIVDIEKSINAEEVKQIMATFETQFAHYLTISEKVVALADQEKDGEATYMILEGEFLAARGQVQKTVQNFVEVVEKRAEHRSEANADDAEAAIKMSLTILGSIVFFMVILGVIFARNIGSTVNYLINESRKLTEAAVGGKLDTRGDEAGTNFEFRDIVVGVNKTLDAVLKPINEAGEVLQKVADRDMTARVVGEYQGDHAKIKNNLNNAVVNLHNALVQVSESVEQVGSASTQISSGAQNLSQGANEQASSLEEISSSLEEMTSMVKQNLDNANQANTLAETAKKDAEKGNQSMAAMAEAINKIKTSADQTAKIIKTIDEIAFQTNLLALNAAVEAARAGEAGKGFAVVAEEVRNLAQRSAQAAKNTSALIEESQGNAANGVAVSTQVGDILKQIVDGARKVAQLIAEVAAATNEQSKGIDQINGAVSEMNKVTQTNASLSEESASAAEELNGQAEELAQMVGQFALGHDTNRAQAKQPHLKLAHAAHHDAPKAAPKKKETVYKKTADEVIPLTEAELMKF
ncbi:MAG: hypothetical protein A2X86_00725 [Bdellovibrionales bacterium GWA2_49_15]|nr:MAG: hypothetical protein A2X86_00725 [Bdellovibrionales bacterium GWA2_49_15]HAZ14615.1 methyl-accepting chemotaxis protein [Bdellovibrionales bacterium]